MRDALGGVVVLVIITVFIVVALGYAAFTVNYAKAFRMKNKIVSSYEGYNGNCGSSTKCLEEIKSFAKEIGYARIKAGTLNCPKGSKGVDGYYCVKKTKVKRECYSGTCAINDIPVKYYYTITTHINIDIPIIDKIFDFRFFYITGDTKAV